LKEVDKIASLRLCTDAVHKSQLKTSEDRSAIIQNVLLCPQCNAALQFDLHISNYMTLQKLVVFQTAIRKSAISINVPSIPSILSVPREITSLILNYTLSNVKFMFILRGISKEWKSYCEYHILETVKTMLLTMSGKHTRKRDFMRMKPLAIYSIFNIEEIKTLTLKPTYEWGDYTIVEGTNLNMIWNIKDYLEQSKEFMSGREGDLTEFLYSLSLCCKFAKTNPTKSLEILLVNGTTVLLSIGKTNMFSRQMVTRPFVALA